MTREPGDLELVAKDWHRVVIGSTPALDGCARVLSLIGSEVKISFVDTGRDSRALLDGRYLA